MNFERTRPRGIPPENAATTGPPRASQHPGHCFHGIVSPREVTRCSRSGVTLSAAHVNNVAASAAKSGPGENVGPSRCAERGSLHPALGTVAPGCCHSSSACSPPTVSVRQISATLRSLVLQGDSGSTEASTPQSIHDLRVTLRIHIYCSGVLLYAGHCHLCVCSLHGVFITVFSS